MRNFKMLVAVFLSLTIADEALAQELETIVVTAQKREQNVQDVPIAVSAITASDAAAAGINTTAALSATVPGLIFTQIGNMGLPFIRGVGDSNATQGNEPAVATYIDGVYIGANNATVFSLNNLDRIEVLKGPQGTLFGRNAEAGVIQVITRTPSHDSSLDASVSYGNFDTVGADLYATGGLTSTVAMDLAVHVLEQSDGWGHNLFLDRPVYRENEKAARTKVLWTPTDDTVVTFSADYSRTFEESGVAYALAPGSVGLDGVSKDPGFYNTDGNWPAGAHDETGGTSLKVDQTFAWAKFVSITSFRFGTANAKIDQDMTPLPLVNATEFEDNRTYTQEFQLASTAKSRITWIGGLFYFHDSAQYDPINLAGLAFAPADYVAFYTNQKTQSYAGYGQVTAEVWDATNLTGGLRYTSDTRSITGATATNFGISPASEQSKTFTSPTWRLALDHRFNDEVLGYISYNRGFKSGVFNTISYTNPAVKPTVTDAYEIGFKTDPIARRVRINVAGFLNNTKDLQVLQVITGGTEVVNAGKSRSYGMDLDFDAIVTDRLALKGGVTYLHARYTSFPDAPISSPNPAGGNTVAPGNATGNTLVDSPKWTPVLGAKYAFPTSGGDLVSDTNYYFNSGYPFEADNRLKQPSYSMLNTSLTWYAPKKLWDIRIYGNNLLNRQILAFENAQTTGDTESPIAPRTYGIRFAVHLR